MQLADGSTGLAYTLLEDGLADIQAVRDDGDLIGMDPAWLAQRFASPRMADRVLGLAAINAISQRFFRRAGFAPDYPTNSFGSLNLRPGDHLGMIGFFGPLAAQTFVIVGPSAGCVPDPLFARGVSTEGGAEVIDPETFMSVCSTLEPWGGTTRKYCIQRNACYPGFAALLERATPEPPRR